MGILEFHFHDSEFAFAPSVDNTGGDEASETVDESPTTPRLPRTSDPAASASSGRGRMAARGVGVLVGLAFLIGAGAFARRMVNRRRGRGEDDPLDEEERIEESIEISD
jgi:hypothetical protein